MVPIKTGRDSDININIFGICILVFGYLDILSSYISQKQEV